MLNTVQLLDLSCVAWRDLKVSLTNEFSFRSVMCSAACSHVSQEEACDRKGCGPGSPAVMGNSSPQQEGGFLTVSLTSGHTGSSRLGTGSVPEGTVFT